MKTNKLHSILSSMKFSNLMLVFFVLLLSCEERDEAERPNPMTEKSAQFSSNSSVSSTPVENYTFNGSEGDPISLDIARVWTKNYRDLNKNKTQAHFFGREIIQQILEQPGSVGVRLYYALDEEGRQQILVVGVNSKGDNMLPSNSSRARGGDAIIADFSYPCPSFCKPEDL